MTANIRSPIDDEAVFRKQLHQLLLRAHAGNISLEGGWACENGGGVPSWDVEIFRLNKSRNGGAAKFDER